MVLVVSSRKDEHATAVLAALAAIGAEGKLVDLTEFPQKMRIEMAYSRRQEPEFWLRFSDESSVRLDASQAIWWRRPQQFEVDGRITNSGHRNFCLNESFEAFRGLWQSVHAFWVNHPHRDDLAHRKAFQLCAAREVGLSIPETLITNDPAAAKEFIHHNGPDRTIYKAFSATEEDWRETRLLRQQELDLLDNVRHAPVIFQQYIEAQYDLRVTIIGKEIFAAAIYSQESEYKIDFRMDIANAKVKAVELPKKTRTHLLRLMERLGLEYGAIDMRLMPSGGYVFLEINPAGQWLFIEQRTSQPITDALAKYLASHTKQDSSIRRQKAGL